MSPLARVLYTGSAMLQLSKSLINVPIMSLRIGGRIGSAGLPIINPNNLKIEGWHCTDDRSRQELILLSQDVREVLPQGLVVDDYDALVSPDDLIRMKELLEIDFPLMGHKVMTESKERLGKVTDFAAESTTFYIQKLYTSQSMLRSLNGGATSVDRNQIIEITDKKIVVKNPLQPISTQAATQIAPIQPQIVQ